MLKSREDVRNVAIIAHVDHGKTTLVDELLKQSGIFRDNQVVRERVMDSNDIERERGITILAKNTAVSYEGIKINIIDTPGHADFSGEVERVLKLSDGIVLVVDAFEGPMPQTRFVLSKALALKLPAIVCINKIDRPGARPQEVVDDVLELFLELDADDEQLDSTFIFTSARNGIAKENLEDNSSDMRPLFNAIIKHIPPYVGDDEGNTKVLITSIDYNDYVGRMGIGKVNSGKICLNDEIVAVNINDDNKNKKVRITKLYEFEGLEKVEVKEASIGSIVSVAGIDNIMIGDTLCNPSDVVALPFVNISEPTIVVNFLVNDSPFAGLEGKFVTGRQLRDRLFRELNTDVSLRVEEAEVGDVFIVSGRGELHLSILIETMRREGYEFQVSKPQALYRDINGVRHEPMEIAVIDVPEEFVGAVIEKLGTRKGEATLIESSKTGYTRLNFKIPSRGLIGYRGEFLTDTKGSGVLNTMFDGYAPYKGEIVCRRYGSLVAHETGESVTYGLYNAQERGELFISAGTKVYEGMVVGRNQRLGDIDVNVCKKKHITNMRASGSDDNLRLSPHLNLSLEQTLEFINDDEIVEVTPKNLRIRKKILDASLRQKSKKHK
jgi:GTP-binding protein